jgi:hypothetical protein
MSRGSGCHPVSVWVTVSKSATVRLVEIAELLGVTKQRAHQIAEDKGFPAPLDEGAHG